MNNLYQLILQLEEKLNNENVIKDLQKSYLSIKENKELIERISEYHTSKSEELRKMLIEIPDIRKAKKLEAELNYIILEINHNLANIINKE